MAPVVPVRLRVKLVDTLATSDEDRSRKIIYGLNIHKFPVVREVRKDLSSKLGIDGEAHDLEMWVDDYLVPGYTSSLVFKNDEEIMVKIVTKGSNDVNEQEKAFEGAYDTESPAKNAVESNGSTETTDGAAAMANVPQYGMYPYQQRFYGGYQRPRMPPPQWGHTANPSVVARNIPSAAAGYFQKPAMQCAHWDNHAHVKANCKFWHPRELCKNYPNCVNGAANCGYAHPFCGDVCECPKQTKDPQKNHYRQLPPKSATPIDNPPSPSGPFEGEDD